MVSSNLAYKVVFAVLLYGKLTASPLNSALSYQPQKYLSPSVVVGASLTVTPI